MVAKSVPIDERLLTECCLICKMPLCIQCDKCKLRKEKIHRKCINKINSSKEKEKQDVDDSGVDDNMIEETYVGKACESE